MRSLIRLAFQPLLLGVVACTWLVLDSSEGALLVTILGALALLTVLELWLPAQPAWKQSPREKAMLFGIFVAFGLLLGLMESVYASTLVPALQPLRGALRLDVIWPASWPLLAQALLLYFSAEFIYYWIHRLTHRSAFLWRASGHGFHHAFPNLHALNAGANHPFELLFLALPAALIAGLFAAPQDAFTGAAVLLAVNSTIVHANLDMDTPVLGWFVTTPAQHRRHHSSDFAMSNTNYSCNAILWDRLFGTYGEGKVEQTGIGPGEPTLWQKLLLPFREPGYADTVSSRRD